ncbi:AAA family ATPase [Brucepastera parasyntrophica]|uniref:AAA family ATPase n=1 Tax=Brucepastera parasyntrophica TaxID=2880008 RepID=UPI00210E1E1E|nr:AAA family ATPase [Brucepastera parasyntrophica]ULQ58644.1 AAA family ATPase [Brucepastera parasyntrophica]
MIPSIIITGGPGAGKTTLINELSLRGYKTVPETAREIIRHQMETGGEGLPWKNRELYTQLMLECSIRSYTETYNKESEEAIFFDRGILDTFCYAKMIAMTISGEMNASAYQYKYNRQVFLLPAWKEIYGTDTERKQSWEEAVFTYEMMKKTYMEYDYDIIEVPKVTAEKRADFILDTITR